MSTLRACLICTAPSNYAHFGIDSCRSCADFYKRTVVAGRVFQCRKGDGKCTIKQKDRHNCRGCRFEKCMAFGMKYDTSDKESLPDILPSASIQANEPFLTLISREHSLSIARRKILEITLQPTSLHRQIRAEIDGEDLLLCTWTFLMDCVKLCTDDYLQFASASFPEFTALSSEDQQLMLRNFSVRLFNAEIHCDTFRRFGSSECRFSMATITTCYDTNNFEFVTEYGDRTLNKAIAKLVGPILKKSSFTDTEMHVVFALLVWLIDPNQCLPDHMVELARKVRGRILDALKEYYRDELHLSDYSVRMGNLITFEHTIQDIPNILGESMQVLSVSGMLSEDASFLEEFMKISF